MKLTRRVAFSSGHRYWREDLDATQNRALFGQWASPFNHGHNYVLDVTCEGDVDPRTGMVVNIKTIDDALKTGILASYDQKSLNDEVPSLEGKAPSLENLILDVAQRVTGEGFPAQVASLRLDELPRLWAEYDTRTTAMTITRTYEFAASHRLHSDHLSKEENLALYGKCENPNGHGHNYVLEVTVGGEVDPRSGFLCDLGALDAVVEAEVVRRYDHKNLNLDVPELFGKITTSEVVVQAIWDRLVKKVPARLERVRLWETARNMFEVSR